MTVFCLFIEVNDQTGQSVFEGVFASREAAEFYANRFNKRYSIKEEKVRGAIC